MMSFMQNSAGEMTDSTSSSSVSFLLITWGFSQLEEMTSGYTTTSLVSAPTDSSSLL